MFRLFIHPWAGVLGRLRRWGCLMLLPLGLLALAWPPAASAQAPSSLAALDQGARVALAGAAPAVPAGLTDQGPVAGTVQVHRIQLVLARTPAQEAELASLLAAQQDPHAAAYHRWLSAAEFGRRFGPPEQELAGLTTWLSSQGFNAVNVNQGHTLIEVSGPASAVEAAFGARLHLFSGMGGSAYANVRQPTLPAAYAGLVRAIASLDNLPRPRQTADAGLFRRDNATGAMRPAPAGASARAAAADPAFTVTSNAQTVYAITPYDFAAMYDVLPLWNGLSAIDGTGQTIAVIGETDIAASDFVSFRTLFGLPVGSTATQTGTSYLNIIYNGVRPLVTADEAHADADTQWAGAAARGAVIDYVASTTTEASSGLALSAAYVVDNDLAPVLVDSYSSCELRLGTAGNAFYSTLWQQAAAEGITVVTASGDAGAAGCDAPHADPATGGRAVNGIASTPFALAVGGTELYLPNGAAAYFAPGNTANFQSVSGYIPEAVWNDTCTNPLILAQAPFNGEAAEQACNQAAPASTLRQLAGSGGGASACITSDGQTAASCAGGYAKPAWQSGAGVPADGLRDVPDVALFASQGRTNNFYVVCQQSRDADGLACNLNAPYTDFSASGGTDVAAPAFAGILALAAQRLGERLGNAAPVLYELAARQTQAGTSCGATGGGSSGCLFHDITLGTNTMPCVAGTLNCVITSAQDALGVLNEPAAAAGYDLATGLGSVDAANLIAAWAALAPSQTTAVLSVSPASATHGSPIQATVTVTGSSGQPGGQVALEAQAANGFAASGALSGGSFTASVRDLPGGTYGLRAHYAGDQNDAPADSNFVSVTIAPEPSTIALTPLVLDPLTNKSTVQTTVPYGTVLFLRADVAGASGQGIATGNINLTDNGALLATGVIRLNSSGYAEAQTDNIAPGTQVFSASYTGDQSFNASSAAPLTVTITKAATTASVTANVSSVTAAGTVTLTALVDTQSFGYFAPTGFVTFYSGATRLGTAALSQTSDATYHTAAVATVTMAASTIPLGVNSITITYPGDANYLASASPASSLNVTPSGLATTVTTASVTPALVAGYQSVSVTAQVARQSAPGQPDGPVQFLIDGANAGSPVPLTGSAAAFAYAAATLNPGQHTAQAVYLGDPADQASVSAAAPFVVTAPALYSTTTFTATPSTLVQATFVSVAVQVGPASQTATGTVQLVLDGGLYGTPFPLSGAQANLPLTTGTLQTGTHVLTVFYAGDHNFSASYATPANLYISAPGSRPTAVTLNGLPATVAAGSNAAFTATVTPSQPVPTGILQIAVDGANPGLPVLLSGAVNALSAPTAGLTPGPHTLRVFYSGDNTYGFSTSAPATFVVSAPAPGQATFALDPKTVTLSGSRLTGGNPTVPYTLTPGAGFSGTVTLSCSGLPANTACSFAPASVALSGTAAQSTVLTIQLNTGLAMNLPPGESRGLLAVSCAGLVGFVFLRRRRRVVLAVVLAVMATGALAGCGKGFAPGTSAPGTYGITVTALGNGVTQTSVIHLTIS